MEEILCWSWNYKN